MLKKMKNKQKTVAEKVAELISHHIQSDSGSDSADEATAAKIIEYDDDEYELPSKQTTEFRKRNVKLLSEQNEKYKGKIASRKDFESDQSEDEEVFENSDTSDDEEALAAFSTDLRVRQSEQHKYSDSEIEDNDNESDVSGDSDDDNNDQESEEEDDKNEVTSKVNHDSEIEDDDKESDDSGDSDDDNTDQDSEMEDDKNQVISKVNHEAEIQKGFCVQHQLHIWERLLEIRINLQKVLNKTSQFPPPHEFKDLEGCDKHKAMKDTICKQTCLLLQNLLSLKNNLSSQFPEVEKIMKPCLKRPLPFNDNTMGEPPLKQVNQYLEDNFKQFSPYRNDVLLKWDDRTKLLQPGAGSNKKSFNEEYDITKKIENALINRTQLIEKSQQLKTAVQNERQQETIRNPNIYDDSDFYHQQLRELIEYKANTTSNMSEVTKQFLELQKLRQKMKKKVDTRASKGRKLRYVVHNKLINFMAPHDNYTWTMESIDELSKSLFV